MFEPTKRYSEGQGKLIIYRLEIWYLLRLIKPHQALADSKTPQFVHCKLHRFPCLSTVCISFSFNHSILRGYGAILIAQSALLSSREVCKASYKVELSWKHHSLLMPEASDLTDRDKWTQSGIGWEKCCSRMNDDLSLVLDHDNDAK